MTGAGISSQIESVHAEQTYRGIFFFGMVQPVWKKLKHLLHCMGLEPPVNFF